MTSTSIASPTSAVSSAVPAPAMPTPRVDTGRVSDLIAQLLVALGEDLAREGPTPWRPQRGLLTSGGLLRRCELRVRLVCSSYEEAHHFEPG